MCACVLSHVQLFATPWTIAQTEKCSVLINIRQKLHLTLIHELTFQVPKQYCSLQHQASLSPPDTSTTECHFSLGQMLHSFWISNGPLHIGHLPTWGGGFHLPVSYIFAFSYCWQGSTARMPEQFVIPSSGGLRFVRTLHYDLTVFSGPKFQAKKITMEIVSDIIFKILHIHLRFLFCMEIESIPVLF